VPTKGGVNTVRLGKWRVLIGGLSVSVDASRSAIDLKKANIRWPGMGPGGVSKKA